jgi:RNA recognition motif-containing protein
MAILYVGNLPFKVTDEALTEHFATAGEVAEVHHVRQNETDRSQGCGFITMANDTAAAKAVETLNGQEFEGRELSVCLARP